MQHQNSNNVWDLFKEVADLHNQVCANKLSQEAFIEYVERNKENLAHPIIIEVLIENVEMTLEFFEQYYDYCKTVNEIISRTDVRNNQFSLSALMRMEYMKELLKKAKKEDVD